MSAIRALVLADFRERVRRYSFLLTLGAGLFLAYSVVVGRVVLHLGPFRGLYNSAWIGALIAATAGAFVTLAGFYVVKSSVERDRDTRVGEILAATPLSKFAYLLGKALSNFAVLASIAAVLAAAGVAMQWIRAEDRAIDLLRLFSPVVLIALPALFLVSALAVFFECVAFLRGGFGNVVYFFLWGGILAGFGAGSSRLDLIGLGAIRASASAAIASQFGAAPSGFALDAGPGLREVTRTFRWDGLSWTPALVASRLVWIGLALSLIGASALVFDRFDPSRANREVAAPSRTRSKSRFEAPALRWPGSFAGAPALVVSRSSFGTLLVAETKLLFAGRRWWFYLGLLALAVAGLVAPLPSARQIVLPLAWIWPVVLWSSMGCRQERARTAEMLWSCPGALRRQLPAAYLAGVVVSFAAGGPVAARLLAHGQGRALLGWVAGALCIPSASLAMGIWSGSSRLFEAIYTAVWYVGPMQHVPQLDFMGTTDAASASAIPFVCLGAAAIGLLVAAAGRLRPIRSSHG
jgi:hypothetical protein